MEQFFVFLEANMTMEFLVFVLSAVLFLITVGFLALISGMSRADAVKSRSAEIKLVADAILNYIVIAQRVPQEELEMAYSEALEAGLELDPRMAYVVLKAEDYIENYTSADLDLFNIYALAQRAYDEWNVSQNEPEHNLRTDPFNGVFYYNGENKW